MQQPIDYLPVTALPNTFKSVSFSASGLNAVWTPAASKKFRLMRYSVILPGSANFATTAGTITLAFFDSAAAMNVGTYILQVPLAAGLVSGAMFSSGWVDLGNGFVSSAVNNVLNANLTLGGTGAFSGVIVNVAGVEE